MKNKPSGRYNFEKPKKLTLEEKAKAERDLALKAASSFTMRNMIRGQKEKSLNLGTSVIIYEDAELNSYPEIDVEGMTADTFQTFITYLQKDK